ncbi:MAG: metallopeptidase family protein [Burkholderiaceae bacterium]|nr:metallopeptidase family protein [Microbacteriaceae bacterium]
MARTPRRSGGTASSRGTSRDRHGRAIRSAVTGPRLPLLSTRADLFESTVIQAAEYLKDMWPDELSDVTFEIAGLPSEVGASGGVDRWLTIGAERRVILFRLPIERMAKLHRADDLHRRMLVESCVFRAVAELLGKDPWDLAPDRFRHLH